jgi:hypothetical protein
MTHSSLLRTAIKISGLYFIILTVMNVREMIAFISGEVLSLHNDAILPVLFYQIYYLVFNSSVALILLFKTHWIAETLQLEGSEPLTIQADKTDLIELAIIVISALAVLHAFPKIMFKLVHYTYFNDYEPNERAYFWTSANKAEIFFSIFKFVTGLFFLLNARNFARKLKGIGDREDNRGES